MTLRVEASARLPAPVATRAPPGGAAQAGTQHVHFADGVRDVPLLAREHLGTQARIAGPAIITQLDATTLVLPGQQARVHPSGALLIEEG